MSTTPEYLQLRKFIAPEIVFGNGALSLAGRHASNYGARKVFIVTDPGIIEAGWTQRVESSLRDEGIPFVTWSDVTPNPKDYEIMNGSQVFIEQDCDLIIAVGGGSPMDCAKGIGIVAGNKGNILSFEGIDEVPEPGPPMIFIPTTAGTSADVSQFAIVTDTKRRVKIAIVSKMVIPDISLVDPDTTLTMPPDLTAATGMDALCHAFEAYVSRAASPLTDMAALSAVRLIVNHLINAFRNPKKRHYRNHMMMASLMAGLAFSNASLGLVHAMAHSLGGAMDLPHGECNAILLEKVVRFNFDAAAEKYSGLAAEMRLDVSNDSTVERMAETLCERLADLRRAINISDDLFLTEISSEKIRRLSENAIQDSCLATNPKTATVEDIETLFREIIRPQTV